MEKVFCPECGETSADLDGFCEDCHTCECGEPYPDLRGHLRCPVCEPVCAECGEPGALWCDECVGQCAECYAVWPGDEMHAACPSCGVVTTAAVVLSHN